jgi:hypothetical protein
MIEKRRRRRQSGRGEAVFHGAKREAARHAVRFGGDPESQINAAKAEQRRTCLTV